MNNELIKNKMMKKIFIATVVLSFLVSCSRDVYKNITYQKDKQAAFKAYKTFAWLPEKDSSDKGTTYALMRNNTLNYFTHCFGEMGYHADTENPDFLLELIVKSQTKEIDNPLFPKPYSTTSVTTYFNPFLHPLSNPFKYNKPFTYKYFNYPTGKEPAPETYRKNSITLNIIDRQQQKVVWSSTASADLYNKAYLSENLHPVVYKMMKDYPVKPLNRHRSMTKK